MWALCSARWVEARPVGAYRRALRGSCGQTSGSWPPARGRSQSQEWQLVQMGREGGFEGIFRVACDLGSLSFSSTYCGPLYRGGN